MDELNEGDEMSSESGRMGNENEGREETKSDEHVATTGSYHSEETGSL